MKNLHVRHIRQLGIWIFALCLITLAQTAAYAAQVTLAWDPNATPPDGYRIFQRTANSAYNYASPAWSGTGTTCTVGNLTDNTTYYFVARAYVGISESGDSNEVSHTTPAAAISSYTITATAGANGTITPSGSTTVSSGGSQSYQIAAAANYRIADVVVDGVSKGAIGSYTFSSVTANHTISASFAINSYTITATAGANGTITPSGTATVSSGGSKSYQIAADVNYKIADVLVDGVSKGAIGSYTFSSVTANHTISASFALSNQAPIADAGPDQSVDEAQTVMLNGANSMDNDDGIAAFQWRQVQGTTVALSNAASDQPTFVAPDVDVNGTALVFELTVTDHSGVATKDSCIVNVSWVNVAPTADAGSDQTVNSGAQVTLSGSLSTDPDDGVASYQWVQTAGPIVALSDANAAQLTFTAPFVEEQGASLTFELTVTDAGGLQDTDSSIVTLVFTNAPPTADAGLDQQGVSGEEIVLDGSESTDPDDGIATYVWKQTEGVPVVLTDAGAVSPSFSAPEVGEEGSALIFQLTVTDNHGLQSSDSCQVLVQPVRTDAVDTVLPAIRITDPAKSPYYSSSRVITISGVASDDRQVARVAWQDSKGRTGMATGTENWQISDLSLFSRTTFITVTAYDAAGNARSTKLKVSLLR